MKRFRTRRARRAFTLLELLLVMAILVVLATLSGVAVMRMRAGALSRAARIQISTMEDQCKAFELNTGQPPTSLKDLYERPSGMNESLWGGPYLDPPMPMDPWGKDYLFAYDQRTEQYRISSAGKDGQSGTPDDIPTPGNQGGG
ncbi:MAG: type II secretion system protein GspG [Planctomycetota bacterium]